MNAKCGSDCFLRTFWLRISNEKIIRVGNKQIWTYILDTVINCKSATMAIGTWFK